MKYSPDQPFALRLPILDVCIQFIILNTKYIILNTKFIICETNFIILNTKCTI